MKYYKITRYNENPTLVLVKHDEDKGVYHLAKYSKLNQNRLDANSRFDGKSNRTRAYSKLRPVMNLDNFLEKTSSGVFVKSDIPFTSPSSLASCVLGTSASGPRELNEISLDYYEMLVRGLKLSNNLDFEPKPVVSVMPQMSFEEDFTLPSLTDIVKNLVGW